MSVNSGQSDCHSLSDGEVRAEIVGLIDAMTSTGQRNLDDKSIKTLKLRCRYAHSMSHISFYKIIWHLPHTALPMRTSDSLE